MSRLAVLALTVIALVVGMVAPASAATSGRVLHVRPSGPSVNCDGGSASAPWSSLSEALPCLKPGDTLLVHGGVYEERVAFNVSDRGVDDRGFSIRAGRADAPILITNAPGEHPVVSGYVRLQDASHWIFSGIDVTADGGSYSSGEMLVKFRGGTGWVFANANVWNARSYGAVRVENSDAGAPTDFTIVGNCVHHTRTVHPPYQDHNLYIASGVRGTIEHNKIFAAPNGQNIKVGDSRSNVGSLAIRNNILHGAAQNVLIYGGSSNVRIERNIMGDVHGKSWYPNIRGYDLTGRGNAAVDNLAFGAERLILVGKDGGRTTQSIASRANHHPFDPAFDGQTCDGFNPTRSGASGYGTVRQSRAEQHGRIALSGDWNGDGVETAGWYDPATSTWRLANAHRSGTADLVFRYGRPGDKPVVGDWDGDGITTIGIVRGRNQWYLTNSVGAGPADYDFAYGRWGDQPVIGDWNGDGKDTPGLVRGRIWYLSDSKQGGIADYDFAYGRPGDHPIAGDWDGDGKDTPGLLRGKRWFMSNSKRGGVADYDFGYGWISDAVAAGDWNGDGRSTPAVVRGFEWFISNHRSGGVADRAYTLPG